MATLEEVQQILNTASEKVATQNFYFHKHLCPVRQADVRVDLSYTLREDNIERIVNFGQCPHCKALFYHEDYEEK